MVYPSGAAMAAKSATATDRETILTVDMMSVGEGAFSVDQQQRIVSWNETATQLLGYASEDVLGKPCHRVLLACHVGATVGATVGACSSPCRALQDVDTHLLESGAVPFDLQVAGRSGRERWLRITLLPARTQTGDARLIHLLCDVTEQHQPAAPVAEPTPSLPQREHAVPLAPISMGERTHAGPGPSLTRRELEVLHLLGCGLANGEIARKLSISPITARNHVTKVIEKLHVRTRLQAVVAASRLGLL